MPPALSCSPENSGRKEIRFSALMVLPVPPKKSYCTLLAGLLHDLSWAMPVLALGLGLLLLRGTTPALGIVFLFNGCLCLLLRIRVSFMSRRERREIINLMKWQREYRRGVSSRL
jgi:hypothetical protein